MDALCDGCKRDTLTLYGLSMILDVHTVVHLCNGKIWTMMDSPPDEHADLISKCLIHVAYLGRGLFVELVKCEKLLGVIKSDNGVHSYVVGELMIIEQKTFDKMLRTGLGAGINMENVLVDLSMPHTKLTENKMVEITPVDLSTTSHHSNKKVEIQSHSLKHYSTHFLEPSTSSANLGIAQESILTDKTTSRKIGESTADRSKSEPTTLQCANRHPYMEILEKMSLKVSVHKYEIMNKRQTIHITQNLMDNLPSSKYRKDWDIYIPTDEGSESDTTMVYWPLMDDSEHAKLDSPIPSTSRISRQKPTFNINWHGIHRWKPRYWFKCKVSTCDSTFSTICGWNFHHSYVHKSIILKCETCSQKFTSPSAHHAHKSAHVPQNHICTICSKAFPFKSGLRQHETVHIKQKCHRCFAGNCK